MGVDGEVRDLFVANGVAGVLEVREGELGLVLRGRCRR